MKNEPNPNTNIKHRALQTASELCSMYFGERDCLRLLPYLHPCVSWIGTGQEAVFSNFLQVRRALDREMEECRGKYRLSEVHLAAETMGDTACIVYGQLTAMPENPAFPEERLRLTMALKQDGGGLKLVHIHVSHGDQEGETKHDGQDSGRRENRLLRSALDARERQLANLTRNIPGGVYQCANDSALTLISVNDGFLEMFGYHRGEMETVFHGQFLNMVYPSDREKMTADIRRQLGAGRSLELEYRVLRKGGPPVWVLDKGQLLEDENGTESFYCLLIDITDRKRQEEELRLALECHQIIADQVTDIIFEWDIRQDHLNFSPNWRKRFGYEAISEMISRKIPRSRNIHREDMPAFIKIMEDTARGVPYSEAEFRIMDRNGIYKWSRIRATTQYDGEGDPVKAVGVIVDIDEEKRQKQLLIDQAQRDPLTGLYNKTAINSLAEQHMRQIPLSGIHGLMIIDLDQFKQINDCYGHLCGDRVLSDVAEALKKQIRRSDFVGRIGGDEFLVFLPQVADEQAVRAKADKILAEIQRITPEAGKPAITCSIGVALCRGGFTDYCALYLCADQALYRRKKEGRAGVSFCENILV